MKGTNTFLFASFIGIVLILLGENGHCVIITRLSVIPNPGWVSETNATLPKFSEEESNAFRGYGFRLIYLMNSSNPYVTCTIDYNDLWSYDAYLFYDSRFQGPREIQIDNYFLATNFTEYNDTFTLGVDCSGNVEFVEIAIIFSYEDSCNPNGGIDQGVWCVCYSSFHGPLCEQQADNEECPLLDADPLGTVGLPDLDSSSSFNGGKMYLKVMSPLVHKRLTSIQIGDSPALCNYPGPHWEQSVVDYEPGECFDEFISTIPWSLASSLCSLSKTETAEYTMFDGKLVVTSTDSFNVSGISHVLTRTTSSTLDFRIKFPTSVTLSANVTVRNDPVPVTAVLTTQTFDTGTSVGQLSLLTQVPWPYKLEASQVLWPFEDLSPPSLDPVYSPNCFPSINTPCEQNWNATFSSGTHCNLTGTYTFNFTFSCRNLGECGVNQVSSVMVDVHTTDFCGVVQLKVPLDGTLDAYDDTDTPRSLFALGESVHFLASLSTSSGIELTDIDFQSVSVEWQGNTVYLQNEVADEVGLVIDGRSGDQRSFSFTLSGSTFPLPEGGSSTMHVVAVVSVRFADTERPKRRRSLRSLNQQQQEVVLKIPLRLVHKHSVLQQS